jgi:hypothetical protein
MKGGKTSHEPCWLLAVGWTEKQDVESDRKPEQHSPYEQPLISCHVPARPFSLQYLSKSNAVIVTTVRRVNDES